MQIRGHAVNNKNSRQSPVYPESSVVVGTVQNSDRHGSVCRSTLNGFLHDADTQMFINYAREIAGISAASLHKTSDVITNTRSSRIPGHKNTRGKNEQNTEALMHPCAGSMPSCSVANPTAATATCGAGVQRGCALACSALQNHAAFYYCRHVAVVFFVWCSSCGVCHVVSSQRPVECRGV